jgi:hypothetical protein
METAMAEDQQIEEDGTTDEDEEFAGTLVRQVPLGIVFARIAIVTSMSFSAALAIFLGVGGFWLEALACIGITVVFLFLMFFVERFAEDRQSPAADNDL